MPIAHDIPKPFRPTLATSLVEGHAPVPENADDTLVADDDFATSPLALDALPSISWALPAQRSLPEIIKEKLIAAIRSGDIKPGERMVETTLAQKLNVSRAPLREALRALEASHLVETKRGKGTFVVDVQNDRMAHVMSLRAALEGWAARLVAPRCVQNPDVRDRLMRAHDALHDASHNGPTMREVDWAFHRLVCAESGNPVLLDTWDSISSLVHAFQRANANYDHHRQDVLDHHQDLIDSLFSGNPTLAEDTFRGILMRAAYEHLDQPIPLEMEDVVGFVKP